MSNIPFIYRDRINIPHKTNFGLELELDKIDPQEVYKLVKKEFGNMWIIKEDKGLTKGENRELVSPVLNNTKETWQMLKKMGELLRKINPDYNNCSFQVNFDGSMLPNNKEKIRFLKLYAMYEDLIYRFSKGEDKTYRNSLQMYASPIILVLKGTLTTSDECIVETFTNQKNTELHLKTKIKN